MKKYYVNGAECSKPEFDTTLEDTISDYVEDNLESIIDDTNEEITIGSLVYSASFVLAKCDPIAFDCYGDDVKDMYLSDAKYDLEKNGKFEINAVVFEIKEEE